jgi:hypothetical protein
MPAPSSRKLAVLQRRQKVAELCVRGWSQSAIAEKLGIKQPTVCKDLRAIRAAWRESAIRDFDAARDLEMEKLNHVEREAWEAWERSQQPSQMATVDGPNGSGKAKRTVRHQYGDPRFLEVILHCDEARRQLLGLDAPTKIAPTTPDGRPLSREERTIHINAILIEKFGTAAVLGNGDEKEVLEHDPTAGAPAPGADDRRGADEGQSALGACDTDPDASSETS